MACSLSLYPDLLNKIDGEEPHPEIEPGRDHEYEGGYKYAITHIDSQFEQRSKDIWSVHDKHHTPPNRDHVCQVRVTN